MADEQHDHHTNTSELSSDSESSNSSFFTAYEFDSASAFSEDSDRGEERKEQSHGRRYRRRKKPNLEDIDLPQWFIEHCVIAVTEWEDRRECLVLTESAENQVEGSNMLVNCLGGDSATGESKAEDGTKENGEKENTTKENIANEDDRTKESSDTLSDDVAYEMEDIVFQQLRILVRSIHQQKEDTATPDGNSERPTTEFTTEVAHLDHYLTSAKQKACCHRSYCVNCPTIDPSSLQRLEKGWDRFLLSAVRLFAKRNNADLIVLTPADMEDLLEHVRNERSLLLSKKGDSSSDDTSSLHMNSQMNADSLHYARELPLNKIVQSARAKRSVDQIENEQQNKSLTIIYLSEHLGILKSKLMKKLRLAVKSTLQPHQVLFIVTKTKTSEGLSCHMCGRSWSEGEIADTAKSPETKPTKVNLIPARSRAQELKLENDIKHAHCIDNIRSLKRILRIRAPRMIGVLEPYADWAFMKGSETESLFQENLFEKSELELVVSTIGYEFTEEEIINAVLRIPYQRKALEAWDDFKIPRPSLPCAPSESQTPPKSQSEDQDDEWSSFPPNVQEVIRDIAAQEPADENDINYWLKLFLSLLVKPDDAQEGWGDIAIDPAVGDLVKKITGQHNASAKSVPSYGLLKQSHVGGALIYGPPGTGKTHLARILAHESQSTVLCVSPGDIQSKWTGMPEKAIKGLFNLARKLAPCIVFIDEADSLYAARTPESRSWETSLVNQFLFEMDGLVKSKAAPFVLLSTNFPANLDAAVLRRVPSRIHVGLPNTKMREKIFRIVLKNEILHNDVGYSSLAHMTPHFSGSDIRSMCMQAAIMCDEYVQSGEDEGKRLLSYQLFQKALERSSPTVSKDILLHIKTFAKANDALGLRLMKEAEIEEVEMMKSLKKSKLESQNLRSGKQAQPLIRHDSSRKMKNENPLALTLAEVTASISTNIRDSGTRETLVTDPTIEVPSLASTPPPVDHLEASVYQYRPLEGSKRIRVLSIKPMDAEDDPELPPSCTLKEVDLDDLTTDYRAFLSALAEDKLNKKISENRPRLYQNRLSRMRWNISHVAGDEKLEWEDMLQRLAQREQNPSLEELCDKAIEAPNSRKHRYNWGEFIAMSYVWGDISQKNRYIHLDGSRFRVGSNLYDLMVRLSNSSKMKTRNMHYWIDAICINQQDLEERAREVQKMDLIYMEAMAVQAWLGSPTTEVTSELSVVRTVLDSCFDSNDAPKKILGRIARFEIFKEAVETINAEYSVWLVLSAISSEPYWQRLWIIQEISLAYSLILSYGEHDFTSKEFWSIMETGVRWEITDRDQIPELKKDPKKQDPAIHCFFNDLCTRFSIRNETWKEEQASLRVLLRQACHSEASNLRDKVYGLYAMLPPAIARTVTPNYEEDFTLTHCWVSFARSCFEGENNLNQLARSSGSRSRAIFGGMGLSIPSWAFDLSSKRRPETSSMDDKSWYLTAYSFSIEELAEDSEYLKDRNFEADLGLEPTFSFDMTHSILNCQAIFIDKVNDVAYWNSDTRIEMTIYEPQTGPVDPQPDDTLDFEEIRRSLARVLCYDPTHEIADGPTLLDIPWAVISQNAVLLYVQTELSYHTAQNNQAEDCNQFFEGPNESQMSLFYNAFLKPNENFDMNGTLLRDLFISTEKSYACSQGKAARMVEWGVSVLMMKRLMVTDEGRVGAVAPHAQSGDKIAIVAGCDMPVVLRERSEGGWIVIGGCFVDGLMCGEAAEGVASGKWKLEDICIY